MVGPPRHAAEGETTLARAVRLLQTKVELLCDVSFHGVVAHRRGRPLLANAALARMLGYASLEGLMACDDIGGHITDMAQIADGDGPQRVMLRRVDGSTGWALAIQRRVLWQDDLLAFIALLELPADGRGAGDAITPPSVLEGALAQLSHDLRTPLTVALGQLELAVRGREDGGPVRAALLACQMLEARIEEMLDRESLRAGHISLARDTFDLNDVLDRAGRLLEERDRVRFQSEIGEALFIGDANRVGVIARAIAQAACGQRPLGTIEVCVKATDDGVEIGAACPAPPPARGETFALAGRLAQAMGGEIVMRPAGAGVRISARLPLARAAPPAKAGPLKLLAVDDNAAVRQLLGLILTELGHTPTIVADGLSAIAATAEQPYDLVFMDLAMPGLDGLATTRVIRDLPKPWAKTLPIVALTASGAMGVEEAAQAAGMDGFLSKPIDVKRLAATIQTFAGPGNRPDAGHSIRAAELDRVQHADQGDKPQNDGEREHRFPSLAVG